MKSAEFQRRRGKITGDHTMTDSRKARAFKRLLSESGARRIFHFGDFKGWRLTSGEMVCKKQRFHSQEAAELIMGEMVNITGRLPIRAYFCSNCKGYHLTSQLKTADE